ncbi:MAG TPA: NAD-dependent epimerase/dehydratase family protein [Flavobacteriales bacterium]|nr:NAD-dependent epimerase/dehydratase family protein [Flavobacteriales bacterium]
MRIAMTGANGHIGTVLSTLMHGAGHELCLLAHQRTDGIGHLGAELVRGDVLDPAAMDRLVRDCEVVVHLAARISIDSDNDPLVRPVNVDGTRNVVEACLRNGVGRLVHFSSIHSYNAHPRNEPLDELRAPTAATSPTYDRSKASADVVVLDAVRDKGLDAVILAPTSVFGPMDHGPSLLGRAIADLHNGRIPLLPPGGYDFVDVRDVAAAAMSALTRGATGQKYLLSGQYRTVRELAAAIGRITGKRVVQRVMPASVLRALIPFFRVQARLAGRTPLVTHEALNALTEGHPDIRNTKARAELEFRPRGFEETLTDTLEWMRGAGLLNG